MDKEVWSSPMTKYYCLYSGQREWLGIFACPEARVYLCSVGLSISKKQTNRKIQKNAAYFTKSKP